MRDDSSPKLTKLDPRQFHGSAYGMAASHRGYQRPVGEWNFQEVTVQGSKIKVELNGSVILNTDLSEVTEYMANRPHPGKDRSSGFFGFAGHGNDVEFRFRATQDTFFGFVSDGQLSMLEVRMFASGRNPVWPTVNNLILAAVPEPKTYALMLAGLAAVGFLARRRRR